MKNTVNYNIPYPELTDAPDITSVGNMAIFIDNLIKTIKEQLEQETKVNISSGSILWYSANMPPIGYLVCNGDEVSRTQYSNLFNIIGETYGSGNGSSTFNLPDLRGEFIRGWDNGKGIDQNRIFGSSQEESVKKHTHSYSYTLARGKASSYLERDQDSPLRYPMGTSSSHLTNNYGGSSGTFYGTTASTIGEETRPKNIALLPCIKY